MDLLSSFGRSKGAAVELGVGVGVGVEDGLPLDGFVCARSNAGEPSSNRPAAKDIALQVALLAFIVLLLFPEILFDCLFASQEGHPLVGAYNSIFYSCLKKCERLGSGF